MQCFQFSLETLLSLRQAKLEEQEQQLGVAISVYNREQQALHSNRNASALTWQSLHGNGVATPNAENAEQGATDCEKSHSAYLYLNRLEKQSREIDEKLHEARSVMEEEQKRYAEMRKDMRVLERLREKQFHQYQQKLARKQDEALAEICHARAAQNAGQEPLSIVGGKG